MWWHIAFWIVSVFVAYHMGKGQAETIRQREIYERRKENASRQYAEQVERSGKWFPPRDLD